MRNQFNLKRLILTMIIVALTAFIVACGTGTEAPTDDVADQKNGAEEIEAEDEVVKQARSEENPIVTITMENDEQIIIELFPSIAPNTVTNFVSLIEDGFYDGVIFHRVIPGFMIQGGDPEGTGSGGPGYSIPGEFNANNFNNPLPHERGVISMARTNDPNSAGSQFFIMHDHSPHLDGNYAAFGKVIEGMAIVDNIAVVETRGEAPKEEQRMKTVTVETHGIEYGAPEIVQ
ncbi:peptidylprolyl isomerase [Alkalihalobacterium sp. APHAB7]|uniref:peptidylprolyl isomerase n=1 Tax=Alkalihalobacterium sp. APHAB7 TaxID=3402081 RepID=UPI003AAFE7E6